MGKNKANSGIVFRIGGKKAQSIFRRMAELILDFPGVLIPPAVGKICQVTRSISWKVRAEPLHQISYADGLDLVEVERSGLEERFGDV